MKSRTSFADEYVAPGMCFGGGGGGGGGGGDIGAGISPSAGPGAGPGAPGTGPASNSDTGIGDVGIAGTPGIGIGTSMGQVAGMLGNMVAPGIGLGMNAVASIGNAINGVTGFGGGTPSSSVGSGGPGGTMIDPATGMPIPSINEQQFADIRRRAGLSPDGSAPGFGSVFPGGFPGMPALPGAAPASPAAAASSATPGGSPEEAALRQAQLELVNQQRGIAQEMLRRQNLLEGSLLQSQGYEQVLDANGQVVGYRPSAALSEQQRSNDEINNLMRTRTLAALRGELPVDPALERGLTTNRQTLEATLRGNLGSGFATSTPGIEALADFDKRAEELRYQSRRDQLASGEGIRLANEDINNRVNQARFGSVVGLSGLPAAGAGLLSQAGAGLTPGLQNLLGGRQLTLQEMLGNLDANTRLQLGMMSGATQARSDQTRLEAADNAGLGQALGSLGTAFLSNPSTFSNLGSAIGSGLGSIGSGIGDFFGGLFG